MSYRCTTTARTGEKYHGGTYYGVEGAATYVRSMLQYPSFISVRVEGPDWTVIVKRKAKK